MLEYSQLARLGKTSWRTYVKSLIFLMLLSFSLILSFLFAVSLMLGEDVWAKEGPIRFILINLSFVIILIILYFSVESDFIHNRSFITLITPYKRIKWKNIFFGFITFIFLMTVYTIVEYLIFPEDFKFVFNPELFIIYLPLVLLLTPLQTAVEELFFRGYLIQAFGLKIKNHVLLSAITALIFVLDHLYNTEHVSGFLVMTLIYFTMGFFLAIVTLKSNSLEIALGIHAANNIFALLFVNYAYATVKTSSIFYKTNIHPWFSLVSYIFIGIIIYTLVLKYYSVKATEANGTKC